MSGFRDIRRKMRRDVQANLCVPALYLRTPASEPVAVNVRVHPAFNKIGNVQGARTYPAQMQNESDTIRFDLSELARPERGGVVSIVAGEAYRLDNVLPPDDQFQTAEATRLEAKDCVGLPVPVST